MLTKLERIETPTASVIRSDGGRYFKMKPGMVAERITQQEAIQIALQELDWEDKFVPHNVD